MLVRIILTTVTYLLHISLEFVVNTTVSDDIILQWGYANIDLDNTHKIATLPIAFKDTTYRVIATPAAYTGDTYFYSYKWNDKDSTTTQIQFEMRQNNGGHSTAGLVYVAVGVG